MADLRQRRLPHRAGRAAGGVATGTTAARSRAATAAVALRASAHEPPAKPRRASDRCDGRPLLLRQEEA
jgi:hypothetical protein